MFLHSHGGVEFSLFGLQISLYGIMITLGILVAAFLAIWLGKKRNIKSDDIMTMALYVIPLAILGARTYFVIFSTYSFTFIEFLSIWNGGLAILGGVIGGTIGVIIYCLIHKKNFFDVADVVAPCLIIGQCIGRIGCFFAGCCFGVEITNPALHFWPVGISIDGIWHYATMFWESFWCLICFFVLLIIFRRFKEKGVSLCSYLILYGVGRSIIESFRGDSLYFLSTGIRVSQLLSIILIILGIIGLIIIYTRYRKRKSSEKNDNS